MTNKIYDWKRFWCPRTGSINLSDGGYLYDPESEFGHIYNPDLVSFESIANVPCLVLLGEPGMGKTYTMQTERKAIDTEVEKEGGQTLWLDLRAYGSEDRLVHNLFESTTFASWVNSGHQLHIFLDSLDECLLRINTLSALLIDEFGKHPIERLYLRIACRTAEWPSSLETGLKKLWGDKAVGVYELAPLRRIDAIEAARANNLAPEAFLSVISQREVVPLAIKPVTLDFLIRMYSRHGQLPSTQTELYLHGCRLLCEETSESRRDAGYTGDFTAEQRMAVASRIAAVTVFANKYAIWTGLDRGDVPDEDITIQKLCGGNESPSDEQFQVGEAAIKETLATGLFSSRGLNRMSWAHQTYAEFLAARYLVQHKMTLTQMMNLIVHAGDPERRIVPQLHETAAWLAGMVPDVFREIMKIDPEVLLRSDVATADVKDRVALVEILLKLYDEEKLLDFGWDVRLHYRKLAHPDLAEQLLPYICDSTKGNVVRRVAIDIAEACELQMLQNDLADIALDPSQPFRIRINAAFAVWRIGDDTAKVRLKPLALGEAGDDPKDELKGCGLLAVWPSHMTADELFAILTLPRSATYYGAYWMFLSSKLVQNLTPSALPAALRWIEEQDFKHQLSYIFEEVVDGIMLQAWEHLEMPDVLNAFAKTLLTLLKQHYKIEGGGFNPPFKIELSDDDDRRHLILVAMIPLLPNPEKDSAWLAYHGALILSKDIPWMIERLRASESKETQLIWVQLIKRAFDWHEPDHFDIIFFASQNNPILADAFSKLLKPVELNSPEAQEMREDHLEMQKWSEQNRNRPLLEPLPAERIAKLLEEFETGNLDAWWHLNIEMTLEPDSTRYGDELESDLTALPGWKTADAKTRARIVEAAKRYVIEQDPKTNEWLGTNTSPRSTLAGYRALRLLLQEDPDFISTMPTYVWKRWAPIILAYPESNFTKGEEPQRKLVKLAYEHTPEEIIHALMILIDKENKKHDYISITRKVEHCWDIHLANALLNKAKNEALKPECMGCLLSDLLDHKISEARTFAESLVRFLISSFGEERARAIVAASVLIAYAEDAGWSIVWPAILKDTEFGQEVISKVAHKFEEESKKIGLRLTEDQLADLYIWLVQHYPHDEDLRVEGVCVVGPRESIAEWRDFILQELKVRGTNEACEAIQRIIREFPELNRLKWTLMEAQNNTRQRTWTPLRPEEILKMANNQQVRLVQSGHQLLDVLIESLKRLEEKLQGETPAAQFLWDETNNGLYKPKDENSFSDYVKMHIDGDLRQRGVIANREVRIHEGERTDIHVDAVIRGPNNEVYDSVTVIIEVKGCWNPELKQAMKRQLVDRYLRNNRCQHGLYLVGWFNCDQWNDRDYRKKQAPGISKDEAQKRFDAQAAELSQQGTEIRTFIINTAL